MKTQNHGGARVDVQVGGPLAGTGDTSRVRHHGVAMVPGARGSGSVVSRHTPALLVCGHLRGNGRCQRCHWRFKHLRQLKAVWYCCIASTEQRDLIELSKSLLKLMALVLPLMHGLLIVGDTGILV